VERHRVGAYLLHLRIKWFAFRFVQRACRFYFLLRNRWSLVQLRPTSCTVLHSLHLTAFTCTAAAVSRLSQAVKLMFSFVIGASYAIQFYVPMQILWGFVQRRFKPGRELFWQLILRSTFVVLTCKPQRQSVTFLHDRALFLAPGAANDAATFVQITSFLTPSHGALLVVVHILQIILFLFQPFSISEAFVLARDIYWLVDTVLCADAALISVNDEVEAAIYCWCHD